jgi:DNA-binding transcriptional regulator YhcF (GntR family)
MNARSNTIPDLRRERQPKYLQIAELYYSKIQSGDMAAGVRFPGEMELAEAHAVSRVTVRKALDLLSRQGLIQRSAGRGTFVRGATDRPAEKVRQVVFLFVDQEEGESYWAEELRAAEHFFASRQVGFSWAHLRTEDLLAGRMHPALANNLSQAALMDGNLKPFHTAIAERFRIPCVVVGNHALPRTVPQVRFVVEPAVRSQCLAMWSANRLPVVWFDNLFDSDITREIGLGYTRAIDDIGSHGMAHFLTHPIADHLAAIDRCLDHFPKGCNFLVHPDCVGHLRRQIAGQNRDPFLHQIATLSYHHYLSDEDLPHVRALLVEPVKLISAACQHVLDHWQSAGASPLVELAMDIQVPAWMERKLRGH